MKKRERAPFGRERETGGEPDEAHEGGEEERERDSELGQDQRERETGEKPMSHTRFGVRSHQEEREREREHRFGITN